MKTPITKEQIHEGKFVLPSGFYALIQTERDEDAGEPWKECDGHGPVSEWTDRGKRAGERVLCSDRGGRLHRYYDYAAAIREARRDGWDAEPYKTGTKGQQAARAVEADYEFLRSWCADEWEYLIVTVKLFDAAGKRCGVESLGWVESRADYWKETAADLLNELIEANETEAAERAHWAARDVVTV